MYVYVRMTKGNLCDYSLDVCYLVLTQALSLSQSSPSILSWLANPCPYPLKNSDDMLGLQVQVSGHSLIFR